MSTFFIVLIVIVVLILIWAISIYNTLIQFIEAINNDKKQIDIQLDRRFKVFESLIEAVKKYMDYEQTTLKDVVALRNQAQAAKASGDEQGRIAAENQISQIASGLNVVFERYPDLKASQNVMQLQEEIVNTENKLAYSKQAYNDAIERYNAKKKSFFESIIVSIFPSSLDKDFVYWGLSEEQIKVKEDYTVKF
ncbi:LemA family protein [Legionella longbeachae]|uniref:Putative LemA from Coxiella burnetii n=1 Tax=Legionella longbeachae serogroup 1 (strain NSW150) TaxID=661367 RepID=D3HPS2_LEGLN|nr:LemA family protein [Legionella longbeachae]VEE01408.1 LemA from Coxiella burnetii [Legionella oakridgensis]HBD7396126.1 LemA family protein [Legionella pneumophila]ARB92228.1 LemA family protein [Legionella longbeachae]ARM34591.1 LemA family protein [Legionella longbeachae]EEZ96116.1 LemA protein [Legionella longbeachae D-4968]